MSTENDYGTATETDFSDLSIKRVVLCSAGHYILEGTDCGWCEAQVWLSMNDGE